jgi:CubicO group peptidase (beta-lactamase class C family)
VDDPERAPTREALVADVLAEVDAWPVDTVAAGVTDATTTLATVGPGDHPFPLASVTKPLSALGVLLAVQYGDLHLDEPAGPEGATVRHLLAHAGGLPMTSTGRTVAVGTRRVYSNVGFDLLGELVAERVGTAFAEHLEHEVFAPLGMDGSRLDGSPAHAATSTVDDLLALGRELLAPELLDDGLARDLATVQFDGLDGVVPGYGRQVPCPWGLGVEIRGTKSPHWTGPEQSPAVFGHFGQSGTYLWVDRALDAAVVVLTDRDFGPWAVDAWAPCNQRLADALEQR